MNIPKFKEIIITTSDHKVNIEALKKLRELNKEALIIVNAPSSEHVIGLKKLGADFVVTPDRSMSQIIVNQLELSTYWRKKDHLKKILEKSRSLAIIMHDNPDPDAMSSAYALKTIAESFDVETSIYYGGEIGHDDFLHIRSPGKIVRFLGERSSSRQSLSSVRPRVSPLDELVKLEELRNRGTLSESEYAKAKSRLLDQI